MSTERIDLPEDAPLNPERHRSRWASSFGQARDVVAAVIACFGAISLGFTLGYSSPALRDQTLINILGTEENKSWFGSLVTLGAMLGGPIGAVCAGRLGRRTTLMLCNIPLAIGWFLIIYASNIGLLFSGRILTGFGIGAVSLAAPVYVAEVAVSSRRGALGSGFQLLVTVGIFVSYGLGALVSWTWLAVTGAVLAFLHAVLLLIVPETPRWLLSHHDRQGALSSLQWLRGSLAGAVDIEFNDMEQYIVNTQLDGSNRLKLNDLYSPSVYKPLLVSVFLMIFQQFSGVNAVIFYTTDIFARSGFDANPSTPTVIVGAVLVVATGVSCVLADSAGRRVLLMVSGTLMCLSIIVLGVDFFLFEVKHVTSIGWLALVCVIVYIASFSIGWGPVPWLIMSEIFPARAKGLAAGIATGINWLAAFITTKEFHSLAVEVHDYGTFWIFGGICAISVIFVLMFLLETKGKSLEQIEDHYKGLN